MSEKLNDMTKTTKRKEKVVFFLEKRWFYGAVPVFT